MAHVLSVNVGRPEPIATSRGRALLSAIAKAPVEGRVRVAGVNVEGDDQADRRVHGGSDKALYAYASDDTACAIRRTALPARHGFVLLLDRIYGQ